MPIFSSSNNTWLFTLKLLLMTTAVASVAILLKLSFPTIVDFVITELPPIWSIIRSWLKPPYVYILVNFIIISIFASSKLWKNSSVQDSRSEIMASQEAVEKKIDLPTEYDVINGDGVSDKVAMMINGGGEFEEARNSNAPPYRNDFMEKPPVFAEAEKKIDLRTEYDALNGDEMSEKVVMMTNGGDEFEQSRNSNAPPYTEDSMEKQETEKKIYLRTEYDAINGGDEMRDKVAMIINGGDELNEWRNVPPYIEDSMEKPPVSARFGHRKAAKSFTEGGKALRVSKSKRQDTLESTWRMITEGRSMPLARHSKKSDTWEHQMHHNIDTNQANDLKNGLKMKKFDISNELNGSISLEKLKKEPSLSQEELNRRVEAFIKKFNEEMRLQREESLNRLQEMISRGTH